MKKKSTRSSIGLGVLGALHRGHEAPGPGRRCRAPRAPRGAPRRTPSRRARRGRRRPRPSGRPCSRCPGAAGAAPRCRASPLAQQEDVGRGDDHEAVIGARLERAHANVVVLAVEPVEGVLGLVGPACDLVGVLAAGLLVDRRRRPCRCRRRSCRRARRPPRSACPWRCRGIPCRLLVSGDSMLVWNTSQLAIPARPSPIVAVVGATAAGKTGLSLDLAERLGGEVVNTDAMQVYRGMDIGTAKLPLAERRGIPHHLLDLLDVREPATVAEFQGWARAVIAESAGAAARRCWSAARRSTPARCSTASSSPAPTRSVRARARGRARRGRPGRAAPSAWRALDPARPPPDPGRERPPHRPRARGHRAHRPALQRLPAAASSTPTRAPCRSASTSTGPPSTSGSSSGWPQMFDAGLRRRGRAAARRGPRARAAPRLGAIGYREVAAYLRGELDPGRGARADRLRHPPVRAPPGRVVPQGPADHLGRLRRPATGSSRRWPRSAQRRDVTSRESSVAGLHWMSLA